MELIRYLASNNVEGYNLDKYTEELAELLEKLLKYKIKPEASRPSMEEIIEEIGDVEFRGEVFKEQFQINKQVQARVEHKATKYKKWKSENKYIGRI